MIYDKFCPDLIVLFLDHFIKSRVALTKARFVKIF